MTTRPPHRPFSALRQCRLIFIALCVASFAPSLLSAQPYQSQQVDGRIVPPSPESGFASAQDSINSPMQIVRGPCDPDYWIVSTRRSTCQVDSGQAAHHDVFRFDGPNPGRNSSLEELLSTLQPGVPVCIMVHGSFVTWESVLNDSAKTYRWLRQAAPCQPVHLIFYSWSSDDGSLVPHLRVNKFGRRAAINGFYVADLIAKVSTDHPICLMGHSHGTRTVSAALHAMAGGTIEGKQLTSGAQPSRRVRVVFAAAAIDHDWLNPTEQYGRALCQAEGIINLRNHTDFPLLFYPLRRPISAPALAITGLTRRDRAEMGDWNNKIVDYDVTNTVGVGHIWAHYYSQPSIASAIRHYVYFDECTVTQ